MIYILGALGYPDPARAFLLGGALPVSGHFGTSRVSVGKQVLGALGLDTSINIESTVDSVDSQKLEESWASDGLYTLSFVSRLWEFEDGHIPIFWLLQDA